MQRLESIGDVKFAISGTENLLEKSITRATTTLATGSGETIDIYSEDYLQGSIELDMARDRVIAISRMYRTPITFKDSDQLADVNDWSRITSEFKNVARILEVIITSEIKGRKRLDARYYAIQNNGAHRLKGWMHFSRIYGLGSPSDVAEFFGIPFEQFDATTLTQEQIEERLKTISKESFDLSIRRQYPEGGQGTNERASFLMEMSGTGSYVSQYLEE